MKTINAIDEIKNNLDLKKLFKGNIALLCHSASVDQDLISSVLVFKELFKEKFIKIFGPQHGFVSDVQDNMIETDHYIHPYFKLPIYSLYSETRVPTDEMLKDVNTFVIDLQDVGTRVYTYISTLTYILEKCATKNIRVIVLDRPNPVGGKIIEGNILEKEFTSFVGCLPIPQRHGLTMGEFALFAKNLLSIDIDLHVITMKNWTRDMTWIDTKIPWLNPSPNLPTMDSALTFCGTVLYEGTNISEGRGTTRSLETIGHPKIEAYSFFESIREKLSEIENDSFILRPTVFMPTFQKHAGIACGGIQIHVTNPKEFKSWQVGQFLCREFYHFLKNDFEWIKKAYEYEYDKLPIDLINGSEKIRNWVENNGSMASLIELEKIGHENYSKLRTASFLYN